MPFPGRAVALAVAVVAVVSSGCSSGGSGGTAVGASPSASSSPAPSGPPYAVGRRTVTVVDDTRPTPANNGAPGAPNRTMPTTVWYPTAGASSTTAIDGAPLLDGARFPLVVFGHGIDAAPDRFEVLLHAVAEHGYVVAAPLFPLSHSGTPGGSVTDVAEQPKDVNAVIARLTDPSSEMAAGIDASHIAVGGHSLGALTALEVAYGRCCQNPNVDAVFSFAGLLVDFPDAPGDPPPPRLPALFEIGDHDTRIGYDNSKSSYEKVPAPKWFVTLVGGQHSPPFQTDPTDDAAVNAQRAVVRATLLDFLDGTLRADQAALARLETDGAVPGVATVESQPG